MRRSSSKYFSFKYRRKPAASSKMSAFEFVLKVDSWTTLSTPPSGLAREMVVREDEASRISNVTDSTRAPALALSFINALAGSICSARPTPPNANDEPWGLGRALNRGLQLQEGDLPLDLLLVAHA
eukprot:CAMPEP_0177572334 /NCGR_PEP_ID=MMETSP0369-20130122/77901_1 /TAXON_ID=447022 ORGANISM="Scrippsiella hangoei-like, Strain SHHI-4" /NCGR_SAMPLE_ID=MMETSP0369 /ASSEMBLY_ACC=CAM_ASM_000364 /LENGTH=125 /DNA_ID=CAMNT_0019060297 /DNA_START=87 /DNA_END=460 /DNA_ORIENTATION=+